MEPTKEQIDVFWTHWGFKIHGEIGRERLWYTPDGNVYHFQPNITLDNLFKYAVPKLKTVLPCPYTISFYPNGKSECIVDINGKYKSGDYQDPALALFWAIWEVLDGHK